MSELSEKQNREPELKLVCLTAIRPIPETSTFEANVKLKSNSVNEYKGLKKNITSRISINKLRR